jgi:lipoate---protein ligase
VSGYELAESRSTAAEFHGRVLPAERQVWHHVVGERALVLGSMQPDSAVDRRGTAARGVEVVRRRSGGGAVLLAPGEVTWVDVVVPRGSAGWSDDVHGPMRWLGGHLAALFAERLAGRAIRMHPGPMESTVWSAAVCFDGLGIGEVTLDGAKLVGMSQRRTREAARLQCCWYHRYDPAELADLLIDRPPVDTLRPVATVPPELGAAVVAALAARL